MLSMMYQKRVNCFKDKFLDFLFKSHRCLICMCSTVINQIFLIQPVQSDAKNLPFYLLDILNDDKTKA